MRLVGWRQDAVSSQPSADKNYYERSPDSRLSTGPQTEPQVSDAISHSVPIGGDIASDDLSGNLLSRTAPESLDEAVREYKAKGIIEQINEFPRDVFPFVPLLPMPTTDQCKWPSVWFAESEYIQKLMKTAPQIALERSRNLSGR